MCLFNPLPARDRRPGRGGYARCAQNRALGLLGGGPFGGGGGGVSAARATLATDKAAFAALAPAAQATTLLTWAGRQGGEPPPRSLAEAQLLLNARNTHDLLTCAEAAAVVARRQARAAGQPTAAIDGALSNTADKLAGGHAIADPATAWALRRQLDARRAAGTTPHCRTCGRFVGGAVDTPNCAHCSGRVCSCCAGRNPAAVKLAALRATGGTAGRDVPAPSPSRPGAGTAGSAPVARHPAFAVGLVSAPAGPPRDPLPGGVTVRPPGHYNEARLQRENRVYPYDITIAGHSLRVEPGTTGQEPVVYDRRTKPSRHQVTVAPHPPTGPHYCHTCDSGTCVHAQAVAIVLPLLTHCTGCGRWMNATRGCVACSAAPATVLPPPPVPALSLLTPPLGSPKGTPADSADLIGRLFSRSGGGMVIPLPNGAPLEAGKNITADNATALGVDHGRALALAVPVGKVRTGRIAVSAPWLQALTANAGRVATTAEVTRLTFTDPAGVASYAYAGVGRDRTLHSYCDHPDCGPVCEHQILAQAHALARPEAAALLTAPIHAQQQAAAPPAGPSAWATLDATTALQSQDAFYRSLQSLAVEGSPIQMADPLVREVWIAATAPPPVAPVPVTPPPVPVPVMPAPPAAGPPTPGPAEPARAAHYTPPPGLTPDQAAVAALVGRGLPGNRPRSAYSPEMQALIRDPAGRDHYQLTDPHRDALVILNSRLQDGLRDPGEQALGLQGPPGSGKNELAEQLALVREMPYLGIDCSNSSSSEQFVGGEVVQAGPTGSYTTVALGSVARAATEGAVIAINEVVSADKAVMTALHDMVAERRISVSAPGAPPRYVPVHPDTVFIFTWNPNAQGGSRLGERLGGALSSRVVPIKLPAPNEADLRRQYAAMVGKLKGSPLAESDPLIRAAAGLHGRLASLNQTNALTEEVSTRHIRRVTAWLVGQRERNGGTLTETDHRLALKQLASLCDTDPALEADQKRDLAAVYYNLYNPLGLTRQLGPDEF